MHESLRTIIQQSKLSESTASSQPCKEGAVRSSNGELAAVDDEHLVCTLFADADDDLACSDRPFVQQFYQPAKARAVRLHQRASRKRGKNAPAVSDLLRTSCRGCRRSGPRAGANADKRVKAFRAHAHPALRAACPPRLRLAAARDALPPAGAGAATASSATSGATASVAAVGR